MASAEGVEAVLTEIGFGQWQGPVLIAALIFHAILPVQQIGSTMLSAPVPFRCSYPDYIQLNNNTGDHPIAEKDAEHFPSQCLQEMDFPDSWNLPSQIGVSKIHVKKRTTELKSCPIIEYDTSIFQSTVVSEWNLVCESEQLRPLFQITYSIGAILGCLVCGQLSDWLGRKRALQVGCLLATITMAASSIVPWYSIIIALRILTSIGSMLMLFPIYTLISEITPANHRVIIAMICGMTYFASMSIFAGVGHLLPHWRKLILICNSPLFLMVPLTFMIDESPRWLLQKGKITKAADLLQKAALKNGVTLNSANSFFLRSLNKMGIAKSEENIDGVDGHESLWILWTCFSSPGLKNIFLITPFMWLLKRTLFTGVIFNTTIFASSNPFEYVAFMGAIGVVAVILSTPLGIVLPRRVLMGSILSISGLLMLLELAVPSDCWWIRGAMAIVSFCLVVGAFQVNYIYTAELFPTTIRTQGFAFTNLIGSIGEMGIVLMTNVATEYQWWASSVIFGLVGVVASLLLPLLPETKGKPLPETQEDVEDRFWKQYEGRKKDAVASEIACKDKGKIAFKV